MNKTKLNRNKGIEQAINHANEVKPSWGANAYEFLLTFSENNKEFMAEEVRRASNGIIAEPPSKRAWGHVITQAVKSGIIKRKCYKQTTNPKAHCTPASLWVVI